MIVPLFLDRSQRSMFVASHVSQNACIWFFALKQCSVCEQVILHLFGCQHLRVNFATAHVMPRSWVTTAWHKAASSDVSLIVSLLLSFNKASPYQSLHSSGSFNSRPGLCRFPQIFARL
jgi:hypothetical protein